MTSFTITCLKCHGEVSMPAQGGSLTCTCGTVQARFDRHAKVALIDELSPALPASTGSGPAHCRICGESSAPLFCFKPGTGLVHRDCHLREAQRA